MKHYFFITALALLPFGLSAQTKSIVRKPAGQTKKATSAQTTAPKAAVVPTKKATPAVIASSESTTVSAPVMAQAQPVQAIPVASTKPATATRSATSAKTKVSHFQIGIRAGGNLSTIGGLLTPTDATSVQIARVTGFHGGLVVNIGGPTFSVQPEVLFSQYGVRLSEGSDYVQFKYNVVEVPLLLKLSFGQPNLRFFINAGPVATFVMSGSVSYRQDGQSGSQAIDLANQGRFSYGGSGGVGISLKAGPGNVLLEGRYTYLLANQADGSQTTPQNGMVSVGYLIPMGGR